MYVKLLVGVSACALVAACGSGGGGGGGGPKVFTYANQEPTHLIPGNETSGQGLNVLDALTGTVLRTVPLPGNAGPAVVDEHTGRAFVVIHRRRPVGTVDPWGWIPSPLRRLLPFVPAPPTPGVADSVSVTMIDATR